MSKEQPPDGLPARVLVDGERDVAAIGDLEALRALAAECEKAGRHAWRPVQMPLGALPFIRPREASYCQRCKLVDLDGWVFWPVLPPGVESRPS
jgi:hypothetical protein